MVVVVVKQLKMFRSFHPHNSAWMLDFLLQMQDGTLKNLKKTQDVVVGNAYARTFCIKPESLSYFQAIILAKLNL